MLLRCCEDELWGSPQRLPDAATQRVPHNCHTIARQDPEALKRSLHNRGGGGFAKVCGSLGWLLLTFRARTRAAEATLLSCMRC